MGMADTLTAGQRGAAAARRYARFMDESSAADAAAAAAAANAASSLEARPSAGAALLQQVEQERKMARSQGATRVGRAARVGRTRLHDKLAADRGMMSRLAVHVKQGSN